MLEFFLSWCAVSVGCSVVWVIVKRRDRKVHLAHLLTIRALRRATALNCKVVSRETSGA